MSSNTTPSAERWERMARRLLQREADERLFAIEDAVGKVGNGLRNGNDVDADDLHELRRAIEDLESFAEEDVAPLVDGADPWERSAHNIPLERLLDVVNGCEFGQAERDRDTLEGDR